MKAKDEILVAYRSPGKTSKYIMPRETYERFFREEHGRDITEEEYEFRHNRELAFVEAIRALYPEF